MLLRIPVRWWNGRYLKTEESLVSLSKVRHIGLHWSWRPGRPSFAHQKRTRPECAPARRKRLGVRCHFRLASRMEHEPWVDVFVSRGHELYVTALPDRELLVAALVNAETLGESIELAFRHWCDAQPEIASRLQGAEQISRLLCTSPLSGRAHRGVAPGVVLLGDAAGFIDPITGGGITQALMTAELLAQHVRVGATDPDQWIWDFERERQLLLRDYHRVTKAVLWLAYHPAASESLLRVLGLAPRILSHLVGVAAGIAPLLGSRANRQAFETAHQVGKGRILRPPDTAGGTECTTSP